MKGTVDLWLLCAGAIILLPGCASLPARLTEPAPAPKADFDGTLLAQALAPAIAAHPDLSGVYPLKDGIDALVARMELAKTAERTLDLQYYIWHPDDSGRLLANQLIQAADRGVHVRLLLDDIGDRPSDADILALASHKNIEVRLFNPIAHRTFRWLAIFLEPGRVNRRMHNKSFTADNQVAIIGGRNIGDEYFGMGAQPEFADLDVVAVGPIVRAACTVFDIFWRNPLSVPISALKRENLSAERIARQWSALAARCRALEESAYLQSARDGSLMQELREQGLTWSWGEARLLWDLPDKVTMAENDYLTLLASQLGTVLSATEREMLIVSAYFVPSQSGVKFFQALRKRGVRVIIVTNSLAATDVAAVHVGYRRCRKALLRAGVELYEFKATARIEKLPRGRGLSMGSALGISRISLHTKTFVFDERRVLVGSLNIDPRSTLLNTEIGVLFDVPDLAARLSARIKRDAFRDSYRLEFIPSPGPCKECGRINWISEEDGQATRYKHEPGASFGRRLLVGILSFLPIEGEL